MPKPDDPDIIARVAEATAKGHPLATAGRMAGLGASVAQDWVHKGLLLLEASPGVDPGELGPHAVFADAVKAAEATLVDSRLTRIDLAGEKGMWAADMTLLERRFPGDFGRRSEARVEQPTRSDVAALLGAGALVGIYQLLAQVAGEKLKELPEGHGEAEL